jgi:hypothetical protein
MKRKAYRKCLDQVIKLAKDNDKQAKKLLLELQQYKPIKSYEVDDAYVLRTGDAIDENGNIQSI